MMLLRLTLLLISLVFFLRFSTAQAAPFATTFDPPSYIGAQTLSGQYGGTDLQWDTNNYLLVGALELGQTDFVGVVPGYSKTATDYWGLTGGGTSQSPTAGPVVDTSYLFRPLDATGALYADFSVRFGIISSQTPPPRTTRDTFGWTFRGANAVQLLRVSFEPNPADATLLLVRVYDAANLPLPGSGSISYDAEYDLHVSISPAGAVSVSVAGALGNTPSFIVRDQVLGTPLAPSLIQDIAATWTLTDTTQSLQYPGLRTNFGSNSMVFNNYAVFLSATPLPTSYSGWATQAFLLSPGANSTPDADPDGDGISNRREYTTLSDPVVPNGGGPNIYAITNGEKRIEFLWNIHAGDVAYQLTGSPVLPANSAILDFQIVGQVLEGDLWRITLRPIKRTGRFITPLGVTDARYFFRLKANQAALAP